ncbi:MAG: hypothetical protein WCF84_26315 [Anaerolineae bacterium]
MGQDLNEPTAAQPWDRQPEEPNRWFDRFTQFRLAGPNRSLLGIYEQERARRGATSRTRSGLPKSWRDASSKWKWRERSESWDAAQRADLEAAWQRRRDELREQEWKASQALLDKAQQMLVFPLATTTRTQRDGDMVTVTEIRPGRWSMSDAGQLFATGSKLARLALGEDTERIKIDGEVALTADDLVKAAREAAAWEEQTYGELSADKPA